MIKDRHQWEDDLKEHFECFLKKAEMANVPDVYTLAFLKAEVEKMEEHIQGWVKASKDMYTRH